MNRIELNPGSNAVAIQNAIDAAAPGDTVVLPTGDTTLDRGLELRDGITLEGQNSTLHLRPSRVYPVNGYHNYGMCDIPLHSTDGLQVGMTVSILDDKHRGFHSSFARITWVEEHWVGLDRGLEADYLSDYEPRLTTATPLIFGHGICNATVRNVRLVGNRAEAEAAMDGCRGGAIYFAQCRDIEVSNVDETQFDGEGISFQMCSDMRILNSRFTHNSGNGLHPGAGSTGVLFDQCLGAHNDYSGFFFCVRANHVTVNNCTFTENQGPGVSIGARDCYNVIRGCTITKNQEPGIVARRAPKPIEVHSCLITTCEIAENGGAEGQQVQLGCDAHDISLIDNQIAGTCGVAIIDNADRVYLEANTFTNCTTEVTNRDRCLAEAPVFVCGHESAEASTCRHLPAPANGSPLAE